MKRFALIGCPVAGSLSPRLFAAAYGGRYPYELVETPSFDEAWIRFLASYDGVNVTAPFKVDAYRRCGWLSPEASACGAVNLVVRDDAVCRGYNTDVDGVMGALQECPEAQNLAGTSALVVGTGGAARAAVVAAQRLGCSVTVAGRSSEKVQAFRESFGCQGVLLSEITDLQPDIVIYTIPVMIGNLFRDAIVLEADYRHPVLSGIPCRAYIGGRRWLLWQAVAGYRLLTGEEPDVAAMEEALLP